MTRHHSLSVSDFLTPTYLSYTHTHTHTHPAACAQLYGHYLFWLLW